jgi:hypothetical protein
MANAVDGVQEQLPQRHQASFTVETVRCHASVATALVALLLLLTTEPIGKKRLALSRLEFRDPAETHFPSFHERFLGKKCLQRFQRLRTSDKKSAMSRDLGTREQEMPLIVPFLKEFVMFGHEVCELVEGNQMLPFQDKKLHGCALKVLVTVSQIWAGILY